jgi:hypothetical protein
MDSIAFIFNAIQKVIKNFLKLIVPEKSLRGVLLV